MNLITKVELQLKEQDKTMLWLAGEMNKTVDGLRLSLKRGILKYNDLVLMMDILGMKPELLFEKGERV